MVFSQPPSIYHAFAEAFQYEEKLRGAARAAVAGQVVAVFVICLWKLVA